MIAIKKTPTADTRTCDYSKVTKKVLLESSRQHIEDVSKGLYFFASQLGEIALRHDFDKITDIDGFYRDFKVGFKTHEWWDNHQKANRHHLSNEDGIPKDVHLGDVIEYLADCVMAGMARSGSVGDITIDNSVPQEAFRNTVEMLKNNIEVEED